MMDNLELQLNFLEGRPITIEPSLEIHKVSFSEVNEIGYIKYNQIVNMLCLDKDQIASYISDDNIDVYTFLAISAYQSLLDRESEQKPTLMDDLLLVLQHIFKKQVAFDKAHGCFFVGDKGVLYQDNFDEFQSIIKLRNCLENIEDEKANPANDIARRILEKRKRAREKLAKAKQKQDDDEPLTIVDLISIFAEAEHMNLEDVFKYDMYQFNNQFNRLRILKDYDVNIQALLAGANDIKLQHWLSRIKTE